MCGIIGYTGPLDSKKILLEGLSQLEYRGYDSAGVALCMENSHIRVIRHTGKVSNLKEGCKDITEVSHCGLGHTRWATHGGVTTENAHPHRAGRVTLVHNGIIENYHQLTTEFIWKISFIQKPTQRLLPGCWITFIREIPLKPLQSLLAI